MRTWLASVASPLRIYPIGRRAAPVDEADTEVVYA